ncbi:MAG TPA: hypothetical protein VMT63_07630 [Bacteroidales bacterium]|nr:hypothetical protein [Bacteroidales bacterium]
MDKSVKINLSGTLFRIDQDAYNVLRDYLREIENRLGNSPGAKETLDDIELRIAEIFQSTGGPAGVLTRENVESMMTVIGKPTDFDQGEPQSAPVSSSRPGPVSGTTGKSTGRVFGDFFGAIGKVFYVIFRIIAIFVGLCFVLFAFPALIATILILFIKNTAFLPFQLHGNFFYLPGLLSFMVNPALKIWICILITMIIILPLLALIYWGVRLIFWFRARDGVFSLVAFIVWVVSVSALIFIISGQGLSLYERGRSVSTIYLKKPPNTVYIVSGRKVKDLRYDSDFILPNDSYSLYANTSTHELSIRTRLRIKQSDDNASRIETVKTSAATSYEEANRKAEELPACCRFSNDTLYLDEFFTLPPDHRWAGDQVSTDVYLPSNTTVQFDRPAGELLCTHCSIDDQDGSPDSIGKILRVTPEGLKSVFSNSAK